MTDDDITGDCPNCGANDTGNRAIVRYTVDPEEIQEGLDWFEHVPEHVQAVACTVCGHLRAAVVTDSVVGQVSSTSDFKVEDDLE